MSASDVKRQIEASIQCQAALDAKDARGNVVGSTVLVHGAVHSWCEKGDAAMAAWVAPGVANAENMLNSGGENTACRHPIWQ